MREDLREAIDEALSPNLAAKSAYDPIHRPVTPKIRNRFLGRLRLFLLNCPDDLTLQELREELQL